MLMLFYSMGLSDSWSPVMFHINSFHDHVMMIVVMIISLVLYVSLSLFLYPCFSRFMKSSEMLESIWTVLPCVVLMFLAAPSLMTLYISDEVVKPYLTLKVIGHQWYWSYEYEDFLGKEFDSYMIPTNELSLGSFRLMEVDSRLVLPLGQEIRAMITSSDVIHSWTIPSLGVKMDAVPGRLNQIVFLSNRVGVMYGQCSEICGMMHAFMPISVEVVPSGEFIKFLLGIF